MGPFFHDRIIFVQYTIVNMTLNIEYQDWENTKKNTMTKTKRVNSLFIKLN